MTISLVLSDKNVYVVRRFSEMLSDENVKSVGDGICSGIRFCPRASTFLSDSIVAYKKRRSQTPSMIYLFMRTYEVYNFLHKRNIILLVIFFYKFL